MSAVSQQQMLVTADEYLAGEITAPSKSEFLSGVVYGMAGGTARHSAIAVNILTALKPRLRGSACKPYNSDLLVHLQHGDDERFYYPDVTVACTPVPTESRVIENPTVVFEVLSKSTERHDRGEKKDAYLRCPSLQAYVLVASEKVEVTIYQRTSDGWVVTGYTEVSDILPLPCIGCELPLSEVYEE